MMGRIVEREVRYIQRTLELTSEDIQKKKERDRLRQERETHPKITDHERRFLEHLEKCPVCGKTPHLLKIKTRAREGSTCYKVSCNISCACKGHGFECGDWFNMLAMAGKDWNDRARRDKLDEEGRELYDSMWQYRKVLTRQQMRTLKGQIFAGDTEGARRGLKTLIDHAMHGEKAIGGEAAEGGCLH